MNETLAASSATSTSADAYQASYVELLKRAVSNSIYCQPAEVLSEDVESCERALDRVRKEKPWVLASQGNLTGEGLAGILAYTKRSLPVHTYVRRPGLDNVEHCVRTVVDDGIAGDLVDAGTLRGGIGILMRGILHASGDIERKVLVADSFRGLPPPGEVDSVFDREIWYALADHLPQYNLLCDETLDQVRKNFEAYGLLDQQVEFVEGRFCDSLPRLPPRPLAVIRADADWYEGTRDILNYLYPMLSLGGFMLIDDYKLQGCKKAVDEYRVKNKVYDKLRIVDEVDGVIFWRKGG
jgi:O-methyltransferase